MTKRNRFKAKRKHKHLKTFTAVIWGWENNELKSTAVFLKGDNQKIDQLMESLSPQDFPNIFVLRGFQPPNVCQAFLERIVEKAVTKLDTTLEIVFERKRDK